MRGERAYNFAYVLCIVEFLLNMTNEGVSRAGFFFWKGKKRFCESRKGCWVSDADRKEKHVIVSLGIE